jgi:hypothetical protein
MQAASPKLLKVKIAYPFFDRQFPPLARRRNILDQATRTDAKLLRHVHFLIVKQATLLYRLPFFFFLMTSCHELGITNAAYHRSNPKHPWFISLHQFLNEESFLPKSG